MTSAQTRRSLSDYYDLRRAEQERWRRRHLADALAPGEAAGLAELTRAVRRLDRLYTAAHAADLVDVRPVAADRVIADLCRQYARGSAALRAFLRSQVNARRAWRLLAFSRRAAVRAVRESDAGLIRAALTAHALEDLAGGDVRDNLVALGLIYHCARAIHIDPAGAFERAAKRAGSAARRVLRDFVRRPDLDRIRQAMGWREVKTPRGVGYAWG